MKCIGSRQLCCFVLVQLAICAGCSKAPRLLARQNVHLIIPEDYRGAIEFALTREPLAPDANGVLRIQVTKWGDADIDSLDRLKAASISASLRSGEALETVGLRDDEVGLRSVVIYHPNRKALETIYFVGTRAALEQYLAEALRAQIPSSNSSPHRVESKPNPWLVAHAEVTQEVLEGTPRWDGQGNPPVSLEHCIKLAKSAAASEKLHGDIARWQSFDRASLVKWSGNHPDYWYWRVRFNCVLSAGGRAEVVVLMNGRVLPLELTESSRQVEPSF